MNSIESGRGDSQAMLAELTGRAADGDLLFLQGYAYRGFARVAGGRIVMPPAVAGQDNPASWSDIVWTRMEDVRLFRQGMDFHAAALSPGRWRWRTRSGPAAGEGSYLTLLAGNPAGSDGDWQLLVEANGIAYWAPAGLATRGLRMADLVEADPETGLAGVVDTVWLGLE